MAEQRDRRLFINNKSGDDVHWEHPKPVFTSNALHALPKQANNKTLSGRSSQDNILNSGVLNNGIQITGALTTEDGAAKPRPTPYLHRSSTWDSCGRNATSLPMFTNEISPASHCFSRTSISRDSPNCGTPGPMSGYFVQPSKNMKSTCDHCGCETAPPDVEVFGVPHVASCYSKYRSESRQPNSLYFSSWFPYRSLQGSHLKPDGSSYEPITNKLKDFDQGLNPDGRYPEQSFLEIMDYSHTEKVAKELQTLLHINKEGYLCIGRSYRIFMTFIILLFVIKSGISTHFPPTEENRKVFPILFSFDCFFNAIFLAEAVLRLHALGFSGYRKSAMCVADTIFTLIGLVAIALRTVILLNFNDLGTETFNPSLEVIERSHNNVFLWGQPRIALVVLDSLQLFRLYRATFCCQAVIHLTQSCLHSIKSLRWTAMFVFGVIYMCGVFCTWCFRDEDDAEMDLLWGNLFLSMFTLFTVLTLEGWNGVANSTAERHPFSRIFFVIYVCLTTLTLLNIVTGIILDAYVEMSNRLAQEASYDENMEKDAENERIVLRGFQHTPFLVCFRQGVFSRRKESCTAEDASRKSIDASRTCSTGCDCIRETIPNCGRLLTLERNGTGPPSDDSTSRPSTEIATELDPVGSNVVSRICMNYNGANIATENKALEESDRKTSYYKRVLRRIYSNNCDTSPVNELKKSKESCLRCIRIPLNDPILILQNPSILKALQIADISVYIAYDVLYMYASRGVEYVTVREFSDSCRRVCGAATGKQLLQVQIELQQSISLLNKYLTSSLYSTPTIVEQRSPRKTIFS